VKGLGLDLDQKGLVLVLVLFTSLAKSKQMIGCTLLHTFLKFSYFFDVPQYSDRFDYIT